MAITPDLSDQDGFGDRDEEKCDLKNGAQPVKALGDDEKDIKTLEYMAEVDVDVPDGAIPVINGAIKQTDDDSHEKSKDGNEVSHDDLVTETLSDNDDLERNKYSGDDEPPGEASDDPHDPAKAAGDPPDKHHNDPAKAAGDTPDKPPDESLVSVDQVLEMISHVFVEPDVVHNIFGQMKPMDVVSEDFI